MKSRIAARMQPWHVDAIGACLLIAIGLVCYVALAQPMLDKRAVARSQAVEMVTKRESLTRTRAARQDTEARLLGVRNEVNKQSVRLEPRSQVNKRLDAVTRMAAESGIGVSRLAPGPTADGPRHGTMTLLLTGKADYHACEEFVSRLHRSFNDTAVTKLRLASIPASDEPVTVELELLWFTAPDLKVPAK
jgi:hypothetical protein